MSSVSEELKHSIRVSAFATAMGSISRSVTSYPFVNATAPDQFTDEMLLSAVGACGVPFAQADRHSPCINAVALPNVTKGNTSKDGDLGDKCSNVWSCALEGGMHKSRRWPRGARSHSATC